MSENTFSQQLLRLKNSLGMSEDQQVAELLGLSKAALSDRKRRNAFPVDKLRALASTRRDLKINVDYVLGGTEPPPHAFRAMAEAPNKAFHTGLRLTQVRHALGLTQPDLAAKLGVDVATIDGIEAGRLPLSDEVLNGMWAALGALRYFVEHGDGDLVSDSDVLGQAFIVTPTMVGGQLRYIVRRDESASGARASGVGERQRQRASGKGSVVVGGSVLASGHGSMAAGRDLSVAAPVRPRRKPG